MSSIKYSTLHQEFFHVSNMPQNQLKGKKKKKNLSSINRQQLQLMPKPLSLIKLN